MTKQASRQADDERRRAETRRSELIDLIAGSVPQDGAIKPFRDLHLYRVSSPGRAIHSVYNPSLCVVVQGSKEFFLNNECYVYDPDNYVVITAELPLVGQVLEASSERPYLGLRLDLDPALVSSVAAEVGGISSQSDTHVRAINVSP